MLRRRHLRFRSIRSRPRRTPPIALATLLVFVSAALPASPAAPSAAPTAIPGKAAAPAPGAPTWPELGNATYTGFDQLGGQVTLHQGRWEGEPFAPGGAERPSLVAAPGLRATGDLDGDGVDEAVILLSESSGGTGTMRYLVAVKRVALGVKHVASASLGDRVVLRSARIEGGRLFARVIRAGSSDAACCPGEVADLAWTLSGGKLVPAGPATIVGRFGLDTLAGGGWVLRGWDISEPAAEIPEVTLSVDGDRIVGSSGCNRYFATVTMKASPPGQMRLGELAGTRSLCADPAAGVEARYRKLLSRVERASFLAGQLALVYRGDKGDYGALIFDERKTGAKATP